MKENKNRINDVDLFIVKGLDCTKSKLNEKRRMENNSNNNFVGQLESLSFQLKHVGVRNSDSHIFTVTLMFRAFQPFVVVATYYKKFYPLLLHVVPLGLS